MTALAEADLVAGVHFAWVDEDIVVLDLRSDAYILITGASALLQPVRNGGGVCGAAAVVDDLVTAGLAARTNRLWRTPLPRAVSDIRLPGDAPPLAALSALAHALAATAAFAEGRTVMRGVGEMRVKESDRIALMVAGLSACGVQVEEEPEGFIVTGAPGPVRGGATVDTAHDHRIAMSHLVLGLAAEQPVSVRDPEMIATSFPGFVEMMNGLGGNIVAGDAA